MYDFIGTEFRTNLWCWISEYQNMTKVWRRFISDLEGIWKCSWGEIMFYFKIQFIIAQMCSLFLNSNNSSSFLTLEEIKWIFMKQFGQQEYTLHLLALLPSASKNILWFWATKGLILLYYKGIHLFCISKINIP